MLDIENLRRQENKILVVGSYPSIIQSILDFDFLCNKQPSIAGIIGGSGRKTERYFWGRNEILIPVYDSIDNLPETKVRGINLFLNLTSGRRAPMTTHLLLDSLPKIQGGVIFAENVTEIDAIGLFNRINKEDKFIVGPASVGLLIPGILKLGAIGGVEASQIVDAKILHPGSVAVLSASGGMTNELINLVTRYKKRISFALSFGGDRFPILTPESAFLAAEKDSQTDYIVYFGELGGDDEYKIAKLVKEGRVKKPILAYIAGAVAEMFPNPPQFGHAKAMAKNKEETATAKRKALQQAGVQTANSFSEFIKLIQEIPKDSKIPKEDVKISKDMVSRKHALFASTISQEEEGSVKILGEDLSKLAKNNSFAYIVSSLLLGKKIKSKVLEEFVDFVLKILVDHGSNVSGAVNTIIAARAGKDLVSALASGLLTIGPRFGGAINAAAKNWLEAVKSETDPNEFVEKFAKKGRYIPGIGHRKYTTDNPDPRVEKILDFAKNLKKKKYTTFAQEVTRITTRKKSNLVLNIDGAVAAVLLDILAEKEGFSEKQLRQAVATQMPNALFVLSRAVGLAAHYLDQKRIDEGLFRLPKGEVKKAKIV